MLELNLTIMNESHDGGFDEIILQDIDNKDTFYFIKDDIVYISEKLDMTKECCKINFYDNLQDHSLIKIIEAVYGKSQTKRKKLCKN